MISDPFGADAICAASRDQYYNLKCVSTRALLCFNSSGPGGVEDNVKNFATNYGVKDYLNVWGMKRPGGYVPYRTPDDVPRNGGFMTGTFSNFVAGFPLSYTSDAYTIQNSVVRANNPIWTGCDGTGQVAWDDVGHTLDNNCNNFGTLAFHNRLGSA